MKRTTKIKGNTVSQTSGPINVALPNTSQEKMAAIVNLSQAILVLSRAIDGVNTQVTIEGNIFSGADTGISVATK